MSYQQVNLLIFSVTMILTSSSLSAEQKREDSAKEDHLTAIEQEREHSLDTITARQINEFHLALLGRVARGTVFSKLLYNIEFKNEGLILDPLYNYAVENEQSEKRGEINQKNTGGFALSKIPEGVGFSSDIVLLHGSGFRLYGDIGRPLQWSIHKNTNGLLNGFSFWISARRTSQTVATCKTSSGKLFVNYEGKDADKKLEVFGGLSIREILKLLENKPGDIEVSKGNQ